jgi:hypothetical protein
MKKCLVGIAVPAQAIGTVVIGCDNGTIGPENPKQRLFRITGSRRNAERVKP